MTSARCWLITELLAALIVFPHAACALPEVEQELYQGCLGQSRIGMTLVREGNKIDRGHYFYQKYLQDIPLTGSVEVGNQITLSESDGGQFHLDFVSNGSEDGHSLELRNSVGMHGIWLSADNTHSYPVLLHRTEHRSGIDISDRYRDLMGASSDFEARVQTFVRAVLRRDKTSAVRFISYPLQATLPDRRRMHYRDSAEVLAAWDELFTPEMMAQLQTDLPHDMYIRDGMARLGEGEAWFSAKGLASLNVDPAQLRASTARASCQVAKAESSAPTPSVASPQVHFSGLAPGSVPFSFAHEPFINPVIVDTMLGPISDPYSNVIAVDLITGNDSNQFYCGNVLKRSGERTTETVEGHTWVGCDDGDGGHFSYSFIASTPSGVQIVETSDSSDDGTGVFEDVALFTFESDQALYDGEHDLEVKHRVLLKLVGRLGLGDRYGGSVSYAKGVLTIGAGRAGGGAGFPVPERRIAVP